MVHIVFMLYCLYIILDNRYLLWTDNVVVHISNYIISACNANQLCGGTVRKRSVKTPNADYCYFHMEILYVDIYKFVTCSMNIL